MGNGRTVITVPIKFDVDKELEELRKSLEKVMSGVSSDMTDELDKAFKSLQASIGGVQKSLSALSKAQSGSSEYGKIIQNLQTQFSELSTKVDAFEKKFSSIGSSGDKKGELGKINDSLNNLNEAAKTATESIKDFNTAANTSGNALKDSLEETKKEALETAVAIDEVSKKTKVFKNQMNSTTTNKKGQKQKTLSWTEFTDFFQTVTKNATIKSDGSLNIVSEKVRTNYEALEKEITKVDKKIIDLMFDMAKQDNETSASTSRQINLLREYLALLEQTRNKQIGSPAYLADQGHAQTIDFVRGKVQVAEYTDQIKKLSKTIDTLREKISNIDRTKISSDYAQDLDNADKSLDKLSTNLQNFFQQIKSNNGQISDADFFSFFKDYKQVMSSIDDTLGFEKIQKELDKTYQNLAKLRVELYSSPADKQSFIQAQITSLEKVRDELLQTQSALSTTAGKNSNEFQNPAAIEQYNKSLQKIQDTIVSTREKILELKNVSGISSTYAKDLGDTENKLTGLLQTLDGLWSAVKKGAASTSDLEHFFNIFNSVMDESKGTIAFEKIEKEITKLDKELDKTYKNIAKLRIEMYSAPADKKGFIEDQIKSLEEHRDEILKTQKALNTLVSQNNNEFNNPVAIEQFNKSFQKVQDTIISTKEKIVELKKVSGISSDYAKDLENAENKLKALITALDNLWSSVKSGNASSSELKKFFDVFDSVIGEAKGTIAFEKIDKEITKLKNELIEINTAIASAGGNTDTEGLKAKRAEIEKTIKDLVDERNAELQLTGTSAQTYDNATASITKYNEEVITTTDSLNKMREKISSLMADDSRSSSFKNDLTELNKNIIDAQIKLSNAFTSLQGNPFDQANVDKFISALKEVNAQTEKYNDLIANSTTSKAYAATREDVQKLDNQISAFLDQNTAAANRFKQQLLGIQAALRNTLDSNKSISKFDLSVYSEQVNKIESEVKSLHQTGNSFFTSLRKQLQSANAQFIGTYLSIQDIIRYAKEVFDAVTAIDSALTELRKVSDATTSRLTKNLETSAEAARDLGASVKDVINMTADWARLGYSVDEAEELARVTTLFKNVGDDMSAETASEYMISALQGFQMSADEAERIVDAYNEVANNFAIDTAGIGEALERSAASFNAANTSMEKAIALVTATNEVVQNPESVGRFMPTSIVI